MNDAERDAIRQHERTCLYFKQRSTFESTNERKLPSDSGVKRRHGSCIVEFLYRDVL